MPDTPDATVTSGADATPDATPEQLRRLLVAQLRTQAALHDADVERALLAVPRHLFLPESPLAEAYADIAVATHWEDGMAVSSASQPAIVAFMLEQLQVAPGMRVLEIGAGTGYNAALLSELVGPTGSVTTIDIDPQITAEASAHLAAAGYPTAHVVTGDGAVGWPLGAPYDRIELSVGASDIAPAWFVQLAEGGILTLPLWLGASDVSVAFRKQDGVLVSESLTPCGFMRLRGQEADADKWATLPEHGRLGGAHARELASDVAALLATPARRRFWRRPDYAAMQALALRYDGFVTLWTEREPQARQGRRAATARRLRMRFGVYAEGPDGPSLALFGSLFPLLLTFGGDEAEQLLAAEADAWRDRRPTPVEQWRVIGWPRGAATPLPLPDEGTIRLVRRHFAFDVTP
jgi:protein-L-isoaspartate(D-aspartate) O-methyltransferase